MRDIRGKTAIVTGAASGIGLGIAKALAHAGANIVLADLRPEPLEAARKTIEMIGVRSVGVRPTCPMRSRSRRRVRLRWTRSVRCTSQ
jgi:NAD(P)-dependent dehydrogenase (short-subunit alcohol dehydrogenase family)